MTLAREIRYATPGGPEVLRLLERSLPHPAPGEVTVAQHIAGVNFIDLYMRSGQYPPAADAGALGFEAAGQIVAIGPNVPDLAVGMRVAYATGPAGAYASLRNIAADHLVPVPDGVSDEQAGGLLLRGMTAHYLLHDTYPVRAGQQVLIHAAAGGVGLILTRWASLLGAKVLAVVGNANKADAVRAQGAAAIIVRGTDLAEQVRGLTHGQGVDAVFDSVGAATFMASLQSLRPRGMLVLYGQASGPVPPIDLGLLAQHGSLFVTRPSLFHYTSTVEERRQRARSFFGLLAARQLPSVIGARFALADAAAAHRLLADGQIIGATILRAA